MKPVTTITIAVEMTEVSIAAIAAACEALYLDTRFNPMYLMLSQQSNDALHEALTVAGIREGFRPMPGNHIASIANPTTGTAMNVYVSPHVPNGVVIFGAIDQERPMQ